MQSLQLRRAHTRFCDDWYSPKHCFTYSYSFSALLLIIDSSSFVYSKLSNEFEAYFSNKFTTCVP